MKSPLLMFLALAYLCSSVLAFGQQDQPSSTTNTIKSETRPVWEFGIGSAGRYGPDYPGADESRVRGLIFPIGIYRGRVVRVGEGSAVRAIAFDSDIVELDVSLGGAFNADSAKNTARNGMPDLDFMFEVGPQIKFKINTSVAPDGRVGKTELRLQTRAVLSTDFSSLDYRGFVFEPELEYRSRPAQGQKVGWNIEGKSIFATEKFHAYFYGVPAAYAVQGRPIFEAKGGYLGSAVSAGLSYRLTRQARVFLRAGVNYHGGAANEDSPLLRSTTTVNLGAGFIWTFIESRQRIAVD